MDLKPRVACLNNGCEASKWEILCARKPTTMSEDEPIHLLETWKRDLMDGYALRCCCGAIRFHGNAVLKRWKDGFDLEH